jgi:hypothetical protein
MQEHTTPTPTTIIGMTVLGQHYDIVWAPPTLLPDTLGHSDAEHQEIVLRSNLRGLQALDTMLHELIHAVSAITGVEITEQQTHILGWSMSVIMRDNPEILVWAADRITEELARDYQRHSHARLRNRRGK